MAKIQASSLCICTDSHLHRLYLFDISRPTLDRLNNQIAGYRKDDLTVSSVNIRDEGDGDAVCADICCDLSGYYVYALLISRENRGAWIKVFKHHNRTFTETGLRYAVPYDDSTLQTVMRNDVLETIDEIPLKGHIGLPIIYQQLCYGAGLEYYNGYLYIITRRKVPVELATVAGYDVILADDYNHCISSNGNIQDSPRHSVRLYEKRVGEVQFNLLTVLNASSGACYGHYYLSKPDVAPLVSSTQPTYTDAVFQGLTWIEDKLITQVRYDHNTLASDIRFWHLQEAKVSLPEELSVETFDSDTNQTVLSGIHAVVPVLAGKIPDPLPASPSYLRDKVKRVIKRIKEIQITSATSMPTPVTSTRGQTALVSFNSPLYDSSSTTPVYELNPRLALKTLPYTVLHNRFPWGIVMAYSLSADSAERKLYGVYGNQLWVYDMMDYTIMVRYPNEDGSYTFFEGDIIDMSDVTLYNRSELQCFLKNNSDIDMIDVHLVINLVDTDEDRAKELFLSYTQGGTGYKDLSLGTVPAGGSKEFWIEIHPQDIQEWEWNTSHRVPLQVIYTNMDDSY